MGVRDFGGLERGRSLLWISNHPRFHGSAWKVMLCISNHPRFHGSAWKVTALDIEPSTISRFSAEGPARNIEPSTISWFSVEGPRSGYRTIHDITVQRGKSPLWIPNHPRYHGSAWKVSALDIEPSTISRFSVEGTRSEYRTLHDFTVQRGRSPLWILNHPRYRGSAWKVPALEAVTKRAERANGGTRAACFEQPEGVHSGCGDARPAMFTSCYSIYIHP